MDESAKLRSLKEFYKKSEKKRIIGLVLIVIAFVPLFFAKQLPLNYQNYEVLIFFILFLISMVLLGSKTNEQVLAKRIYRLINLLDKNDIEEDKYKKSLLEITELFKFNSTSNWFSFNRDIRKKLNRLNTVFEKKVPALLFGNSEYESDKSKLKLFLIEFALKLLQKNEDSTYMDNFATQFEDIPAWSHQLKKHYAEIARTRIYSFGSKRVFERPIWALAVLIVITLISAVLTFWITGNDTNSFEAGALVGIILTFALNKA